MHGGWGTDDHGEWESERGVCPLPHKVWELCPGCFQEVVSCFFEKEAACFDMHAWPERYKINIIIMIIIGASCTWSWWFTSLPRERFPLNSPPHPGSRTLALQREGNRSGPGDYCLRMHCISVTFHRNSLVFFGILSGYPVPGNMLYHWAELAIASTVLCMLASY